MSSISSKPAISLRGLRTFCIAARYESFRTAGEELFITASAVSHQIKSLEEELVAHVNDYLIRKVDRTGDEGVLCLRDWILQNFADRA